MFEPEGVDDKERVLGGGGGGVFGKIFVKKTQVILF